MRHLSQKSDLYGPLTYWKSNCYLFCTTAPFISKWHFFTLPRVTWQIWCHNHQSWYHWNEHNPLISLMMNDGVYSVCIPIAQATKVNFCLGCVMFTLPLLLSAALPKSRFSHMQLQSQMKNITNLYIVRASLTMFFFSINIAQLGQGKWILIGLSHWLISF